MPPHKRHRRNGASRTGAATVALYLPAEIREAFHEAVELFDDITPQSSWPGGIQTPGSDEETPDVYSWNVIASKLFTAFVWALDGESDELDDLIGSLIIRKNGHQDEENEPDYVVDDEGADSMLGF